MRTIMLALIAMVGTARTQSLDSLLIYKSYFNDNTFSNEVDTLKSHLINRGGVSFGIDRFGNLGYAAQFDGLDDYLETQTNIFSDLFSHTISFWFKTNNVAAPNQAIFQLSGGSLMIGYNWYDHEGTLYPDLKNKLNILVKPGETTSCGLANSNGFQAYTIDSLNWNHIVLVFGANGQNWNYYLNGGDSIIGGCYGFVNTTNYNDKLILGASTHDTTGFFPGLIDDIRVYSRALSEAEIDSLFQEHNPIFIPTGTLVKDASTTSIYPNPTTGKIFFNKVTDILLTDITGKVIMRHNSDFIDISIHPAGIYFIVTRENEIIKRLRILKV